MQRWTFADTRSSDTYTMPKNPKTMSSPNLQESSTTTSVGVDGRRRVLRGPRAALPWKFEGRLRSQAEYDALQAWANKPGSIRITDHLGRVHEVLPTLFDPQPVRRLGVPNPWIFDYAWTGLYLRRIP